jgi:hypothetical protein
MRRRAGSTRGRNAAALGAIAVLLAGGVAASGIAHAGGLPGEPGELVVKLRVLKHGKSVLALVPVTIDGKGPFTFAVDTGASRSLIDSAMAKRLGAPNNGSAGKVAGVNAVKKASFVKIASWKIGSVNLPAATIISMNLPFGNAFQGVQGLLGSDMLSGFDVITIDYGKQQLRLKPRK